MNVRCGCIVHIRWCIDHNLSQRSSQSHTTHTQIYAFISQSIRRSCNFAHIHICGTRGPPCYVFSASRVYICICLFGRRWGNRSKVRNTSGQVPLMARGGATAKSKRSFNQMLAPSSGRDMKFEQKKINFVIRMSRKHIPIPGTKTETFRCD